MVRKDMDLVFWAYLLWQLFIRAATTSKSLSDQLLLYIVSQSAGVWWQYQCSTCTHYIFFTPVHSSHIFSDSNSSNGNTQTDLHLDILKISYSPAKFPLLENSHIDLSTNPASLQTAQKYVTDQTINWI